MNRKCIVSFFAVFCLCGAKASDKKELLVDNNVSKILVHDGNKYDLSQKEYERYQYLMNNTYAGTAYKDLLPMEVLGLMSETKEDRKKYAVKCVEFNYRKITKILEFQRAYERAWDNKYPTLKVVSDTQPMQSLTDDIQEIDGDRFVLFVDVSEEYSLSLVDKVLERMNYVDSGFDIYVTNKITDNQLRQWAVKANIPINKVKSGKITLNHDKGRVSRVMKSDNIDLPILALSRKGELQIIKATSL